MRKVLMVHLILFLHKSALKKKSNTARILSVFTVSGRHYLLAKFPELQPGCDEASLGFRFMDLGSCPGGINKRNTAIIFTLEQK
jgi:hypothetical protein